MANKLHQQVQVSAKPAHQSQILKHQQVVKAKSEKNVSSIIEHRKETVSAGPAARILKSTKFFASNVSSDEDDSSKMTTTYTVNNNNNNAATSAAVGPHHPQHQIIIKQIHLKKQAKSMQDTSKLSAAAAAAATQPSKITTTTTTKSIASHNLTGRRIVTEKLTEGGSANVYKPPAPALVQANRKSSNVESVINHAGHDQILDAKKYLLNYNNFGKFLWNF
jgi:hypothetical protein